MNTKALVKSCKNGDRGAFDELIRFFYPYVYGFLIKATRSRELAEDLTQETFLKMVRGIEQYREDGAHFGTWLIAIAKNCYSDARRREKPQEEDASEWDAPAPDDTEYEAETEIEFKRAVRGMDNLPPSQREAVYLRYIEEMSLEEIARATGAVQNTVKSRIRAGLARLKRGMDGVERDKGNGQ